MLENILPINWWDITQQILEWKLSGVPICILTLWDLGFSPAVLRNILFFIIFAWTPAPVQRLKTSDRLGWEPSIYATGRCAKQWRHPPMIETQVPSLILILEWWSRTQTLYYFSQRGNLGLSLGPDTWEFTIPTRGLNKLGWSWVGLRLLACWAPL